MEKQERIKLWQALNVTHDELYDAKNRLSGCFAVDLDEVETLEFDNDWSITIDQAEQIKAFVQKHPNYYWVTPYESGMLYFFSKKPTEISFSVEAQCHNGAVIKVFNAPKRMLIIADLG